MSYTVEVKEGLPVEINASKPVTISYLNEHLQTVDSITYRSPGEAILETALNERQARFNRRTAVIGGLGSLVVVGSLIYSYLSSGDVDLPRLAGLLIIPASLWLLRNAREIQSRYDACWPELERRYPAVAAESLRKLQMADEDDLEGIYS